MRSAIVVYVLIVLVLFVGWVINLVRFFQCDFEPSYKAEIIRGIGIVAAPVGGVVGYIPIRDGEK